MCFNRITKVTYACIIVHLLLILTCAIISPAFFAFSVFCVQPPLRNATKSDLSFPLEIPANAIALPGAKSAGDLSHLSRFPSLHLRVALAASADE